MDYLLFCFEKDVSNFGEMLVSLLFRVSDISVIEAICRRYEVHNVNKC